MAPKDIAFNFSRILGSLSAFVITTAMLSDVDPSLCALSSCAGILGGLVSDFTTNIFRILVLDTTPSFFLEIPADVLV